MQGTRTEGHRVPFQVVLAILAILLIAVSCAYQGPGRRTSDLLQTSPKLNPFIYFEEGKALFVGVDVRAAQYVKEGSIFPLGLGLTNNSDASLTFKRENFTLEDDQGKRYPLVSLEQFNRDYKRSRVDARLIDSLYEAMNTRNHNYPKLSWRLYPFSGEASTTSDLLELPRNYWTVTYLYFPVPEGGIQNRRFTLLVKVDEIEETFVVRFKLG